jgi:hypothetical protein
MRPITSHIASSVALLATLSWPAFASPASFRYATILERQADVLPEYDYIVGTPICPGYTRFTYPSLVTLRSPGQERLA